MGADNDSDPRDVVYTEEQKKKWAESPAEFLRFRKAIENSMNHLFEIHFKDSPVQKKMFDMFSQQMKERLAAKPELLEHIIPKFNVGCRR